jgi:hypothetical protein
LLLGETGACVFGYTHSLANGGCGVAAGGVDEGMCDAFL